MEKQKLYISVDVDKEGMLGKIATAIKLEDELRDVLNEIKREIHLNNFSGFPRSQPPDQRRY